MVGPNEDFLEIPCKLDLDKSSRLYEGKITLTEGGNLTIKFEREAVHPFSRLHNSWESIEGVDNRGYDIRAEKARVNNIQNNSLTDLGVQSVCLTQDAGYVPDGDTEVAIDFDILCFQPQIPPFNETDSSTREIIQELSEGDRPTVDIPEETEIQYVETEDTEIYGIPLTDTMERTKSIKEHHRPVRTGKIRVKQRIHGDLTHQVDWAQETVYKVLELSQLVQETVPRSVRAKIVSIEDSSTIGSGIHYELLKSGSTANVGGRFSPFPKKVLWGDFQDYIGQAYENYTQRVRDDLRVRQVLGYYVDARDSDRPVEGQMLSTCSAIELIALKHAQEDNVSTGTAEKIEHLVNKLDVETEDLASQVVPNLDELNTPEYFWRRGRNYVSHGDPQISTGDLIKMQEATLVLLKRILRNQLLGPDNRSFDRFYSMGPRSYVEFENDSEDG